MIAQIEVVVEQDIAPDIHADDLREFCSLLAGPDRLHSHGRLP